VCAYSYNDVGFTLAAASLTVNVQAAAPAAPATPAAPAAPATPASPVSVRAPGLTRSGNRLVCSPGSWSGDPTGYSFRWLVDGAPKPGARGRRLRVAPRLRGRKVQCGVTAANAGGSGTALSRALRIRPR
jgi:hypothetical protein